MALLAESCDQMADNAKQSCVDRESRTVFVSSLLLTDFRCYEHCKIDINESHPFVVLVGPNGAGKTNILEAISYLAPGRGIRGAALTDVIRQGAEKGWAVAARVQVSDNRVVQAGTGIDMSNETRARRQVRMDGESCDSTAIFGQYWSVGWLTPQMDRLFMEGASSRRRFLDRLVLGLYPDHSRQVSAYERVMRERNRLLQEPAKSDPAWLSALEARMADHGVAIAVARIDFAGQLAGQLDNDCTPFPTVSLAIDGWLEGMLMDGMAAADVEAEFRAALQDARRLDAVNGRSNIGAHKTDLLVRHREKDMPADQCSTGEQKAMLIALLIANARLQTVMRGKAPILLLDEIAAHLDEKRREALFAILADLGAQCWLTGTDRAIFHALEKTATLIGVDHGRITYLKNNIERDKHE